MHRNLIVSKLRCIGGGDAPLHNPAISESLQSQTPLEVYGIKGEIAGLFGVATPNEHEYYSYVVGLIC